MKRLLATLAASFAIVALIGAPAQAAPPEKPGPQVTCTITNDGASDRTTWTVTGMPGGTYEVYITVPPPLGIVGLYKADQWTTSWGGVLSTFGRVDYKSKAGHVKLTVADGGTCTDLRTPV